MRVGGDMATVSFQFHGSGWHLFVNVLTDARSKALLRFRIREQGIVQSRSMND